MDDLPLILAAPLMAAMIWTDLRHMRIPNTLVAAVALLGLGCALAGLMPDLAPRLIAGGAVFLAGLALFAMGVMGGGDVKMLAVLVPLVPPASMVTESSMAKPGSAAGSAMASCSSSVSMPVTSVGAARVRAR